MRSRHALSRFETRLYVLALVTVLWPAHARADWIVSAFGGVAHTQSSTMDLSLPSQGTLLTLTDVDYRGESFQSPQYYGLRGTWIPNGHRWMGIEAEWIHAKVYAEIDHPVQARGTLRGVPIDATIPLSSIVNRLSMSHGLNFILANVSARHGFGPMDATGAHRLVGVVRAGAGPTLPHAESQIDNVYFEQYRRRRARGAGRRRHGVLVLARPRRDRRVQVHLGLTRHRRRRRPGEDPFTHPSFRVRHPVPVLRTTPR